MNGLSGGKEDPHSFTLARFGKLSMIYYQLLRFTLSTSWFVFRIVNGEILDETEYLLPDLTDLSLPFNVKMTCSNNHLKVLMNDDVEGKISYDATLVENVESIYMVGSFEVVAAGYTGTQVAYLDFAS